MKKKVLATYTNLPRFFFLLDTASYYFFSFKFQIQTKADERVSETFSYKQITVLTLYHTIPTSLDPKVEDFGNHYGKRRKCWVPALSPFLTVFSTLLKREIIILTEFNLSSANALNLARSKTLSFGKWLKNCC